MEQNLSALVFHIGVELVQIRASLRNWSKPNQIEAESFPTGANLFRLERVLTN